MHFIAAEAQLQHPRGRNASRLATITENPFAYRPTPSFSTSVCLGDPDHDGSSSSKHSTSSFTGATRLAKILILILLGFGAGLVYHVPQLGSSFPLHYSSSSSPAHNHRQLYLQMHEQILEANDHIVQQLASENQQHQKELARLKQQLAEQEEEEEQERQNASHSDTRNNLRAHQQ